MCYMRIHFNVTSLTRECDFLHVKWVSWVIMVSHMTQKCTNPVRVWFISLKENVTSDYMDCLSISSVDAYFQIWVKISTLKCKNPVIVWLSNVDTKGIVITD